MARDEGGASEAAANDGGNEQNGQLDESVVDRSAARASTAEALELIAGRLRDPDLTIEQALNEAQTLINELRVNHERRRGRTARRLGRASIKRSARRQRPGYSEDE